MADHHRKQPTISIITVCLNAKKDLEKTIQSVISQNYADVQYVILDGGSTDGSLELITEYRDHIDVFQTGTDQGIYDAMNKANHLASGEWVNFLNAGDVFTESSMVSQVAAQLTADRDLVYGNTIFVDESGMEQLVPARDPDTLWQALNFNHNSLFARRRLLIDHPMNEQYHIVADSEFVVWCYVNGKTFFNTELNINRYARGGYADQNSIMRTVERWKVIWDYKLIDDKQLNEYYFQRLLWEDGIKGYLKQKHGVDLL